MFHCAGKMMGLPPPFLSFSENSMGGGVIQVRLHKIKSNAFGVEPALELMNISYLQTGKC